MGSKPYSKAKLHLEGLQYIDVGINMFYFKGNYCIITTFQIFLVFTCKVIFFLYTLGGFVRILFTIIISPNKFQIPKFNSQYSN